MIDEINNKIKELGITVKDFHKELSEKYGLETDYQRIVKLLKGDYKTVKDEEQKIFNLWLKAQSTIKDKSAEVIQLIEKWVDMKVYEKAQYIYNAGRTRHFDPRTLKRIAMEFIDLDKEVKKILGI